jgi:hypothetical protein
MGRKGGFHAVAYKARHPDARAELRKVIAELPILEERSSQIHLGVDLLLHTIILYRAKEEIPNFRESGAAAARQSLRRFTALSKRLIECIDAMPMESVDGIYSSRADGVDRIVSALLRVPFVPPPPMDAFKGHLLRLITRVSSAENRLAGITSTKGPRRLPREVTRAAAVVYESLTGRRARHGHDGSGKRSPFERFLKAVFAVLEVDASPERQAKERARDKSTAK